jgi:DNA polymerase III delta prime subunit
MELSEKYRPKELEEIIGQDSIIESIKARDTPKHYLFIGPPGCGKTTLALIIAKRFGLPLIEFNASDDRGIGMVRNEIKRHTKIRGERIILLDEADAMCLTEDTEIITGGKTYLQKRKLSDLKVGKKIKIPSVNPGTMEIENDRGWLVDSGMADFFEITLENGEKIKASNNHPFFVIRNGKLEKIRTRELAEGTEIVELDSLFNFCEICGKKTFNSRFCSISCKDKGHSKDMSGEGNPLYGTTWDEERRKKIVSKLSDGRFSGKNNPNYGGTWHGKNFWDIATPEMIEKLKKSIRESVGRPYKEKFGERHLEERIKRHPNSDLERIKTNLWISEKLKEEFLVCEDCKKPIKTFGTDGIYAHHKDGNHNNHTPDNIKFVCPSCHNLKEHDTRTSFLEKGWKITHRPKLVHNGIKVKSVSYIGKQKAWNISMERNHNFLLGNGVLTHNTKEAQNAMRRIMEDPLSQTYFILTGNDGWKIIEPIKSRCTVFEFRRLEDWDLTARILNICKNEGIEIEEDSQEGLLELMKLSNGDMRKAIKTLEKIVDKNKKISKRTVLSFIKPKLSTESLKQSLSGDFEKAKETIENAFNENLCSPEEMIKELYESIKTVEKREWRILLYRELANTERYIRTESDPVLPLIQIVGFIAYAWILPHFPDSAREIC